MENKKSMKIRLMENSVDIFQRIQKGLKSVEDGSGFWTEEEEKLLLAEIEGEFDGE